MQTVEQYFKVLGKINDKTSLAELSKIAERFGYPDLQNAFSIPGLTRVSFLDLVWRFRNRFIRDYAPGSTREWPEE